MSVLDFTLPIYLKTPEIACLYRRKVDLIDGYKKFDWKLGFILF